MKSKHKSISTKEAISFGLNLHAIRKRNNHTLLEVSEATGINVGQLSRFENGDFRRASRNLQKYSTYLQISKSVLDALSDSFGIRITAIAARSPKHRAAVEDILLALEHLG